MKNFQKLSKSILTQKDNNFMYHHHTHNSQRIE